MKESKTIYFIRHGEAEHNVAYLEHGKAAYYDEKYLDCQLTLKGIFETISLKIPKVDIIYTSPSMRTLQTALYISKHKNEDTPIIATEIIRECDYTHTPNNRKNKSKLEKMFNKIDFNQLTEIDEIFHKKKDNTLQRVKELHDLIENSNMKHIAIVSHADFLNRFFKYYDINKEEMKNSEVFILNYSQ